MIMAPTHEGGRTGIFAGKRRELSADGFEMTWAVNVLAPFLLTALLADAVTGRVVNVSSISAGRDLDWGNLNQVSGALTK
jgi:NAD(P)-dependent dehydrogenase (short-subunit alcohol dehydrogenase family)